MRRMPDAWQRVHDWRAHSGHAAAWLVGSYVGLRGQLSAVFSYVAAVGLLAVSCLYQRGGEHLLAAE